MDPIHVSKMYTDIPKEKNENINEMYKVLSILNSVLLKDRNHDYTHILNCVEEYITTYCEHTLVYDLIDITPDTSKTIKYCTKCYRTFAFNYCPIVSPPNDAFPPLDVSSDI
jgi:hypothetical protein